MDLISDSSFKELSLSDARDFIIEEAITNFYYNLFSNGIETKNRKYYTVCEEEPQGKYDISLGLYKITLLDETRLNKCVISAWSDAYNRIIEFTYWFRNSKKEQTITSEKIWADTASELYSAFKDIDETKLDFYSTEAISLAWQENYETGEAIKEILERKVL